MGALHPPLQNRVFGRCLKNGKVAPNFHIDIRGFFAIFGTVSSSFSMENRLLYLYGEISKISDFEMTPGEKLAEYSNPGHVERGLYFHKLFAIPFP